MKQRKHGVIIAIDVDNTLLLEADGEVRVNEAVRDLIIALHKLDVADLWLWSGGGAEYAEHAARKFGLRHLFTDFVHKRAGMPERPDICLDDQICTLAFTSLKLPGNITPTPWMAMLCGKCS